MSEDHDWIFDYVLQFLESERFDASVMDFVDDNCEAFDSEDENKLIYTDIHREFKDHVETLIQSNLGELGISSDMFMEACERGRHGRDINTVVFERMIAMDDFMTFKKIMVKRNTELQLEALKDYSASSVRDTAPMSPEQEAAQYNSALRRSMREVGTPEKGPDAERMEQLALEQSLRELEVRHKQEQVEQMELEQALAMSMALEEERLANLMEQQERQQHERKLEREIENEAKMASQQPSKGAPAPNRVVADAKMESKSSGVSAKGDDSPVPLRTERSAPAPAQERARSPLTEAPKDKPREASSGALPPKDLKAEADEFEAELAAQKLQMGGVKSKPKADEFAAPKPLKMKGDMSYKPLPSIGGRGLGGGKALPAIDVGAEVEAFEQRKQRADEAHRLNREAQEAARVEEERLRKRVDEGQSQSEMDERAQHMKEQRARILAAKKKERMAKVQEEDSRKNKEDEDNLASKARAQAAMRADAERKAKAEVKSSGGASPELDPKVVEKRRAAMRMALARRMKMDLMESEEERFAKLQEDHFADLDRKLNKVEDNRRDNMRRDAEERSAQRKAQSQFAKNVAQSAAIMDLDD
jgi:hypothetical protein